MKSRVSAMPVCSQLLPLSEAPAISSGVAGSAGSGGSSKKPRIEQPPGELMRGGSVDREKRQRKRERGMKEGEGEDGGRGEE
jgi:hypothetical protein